MQREFYLTHTIRYDECNCDGVLTPATFFRYMQDIAARDAADAQLVGDGYWVVKRTVISFARPIPVHTPLEIKTFGIGFTRITAQRGYEVRLADSPRSTEPLASARSLWVYIDTRGRPIRLPANTAQIWLPDAALPPQPEPPLPSFPERQPFTTTATVRFSEIDLMHHLNNASAIELLDNAAWEALAASSITPAEASLEVREYDVEYGDSPRFGDQLQVQTWFDPAPSSGQEFSRFQTLTRDGKPMIRTRSRWLWQTPPPR